MKNQYSTIKEKEKKEKQLNDAYNKRIIKKKEKEKKMKPFEVTHGKQSFKNKN